MIRMFDRTPDEDGMELLDLMARILDKKPTLRVGSTAGRSAESISPEGTGRIRPTAGQQPEAKQDPGCPV